MSLAKLRHRLPPAQGLAPDLAAPAREAGPRPGARGGLDAPTHLLALDIETVPDVLVPADWPADKFPKVMWHRVACISFVSARILKDPATGAERYAVEDCRSGGEPGWDERRMLRAFWRFFAAGSYRVVSYNGRAFDLPVLQLRAMIYGLCAQGWFTRGDRWNGYTQRFSSEWHADLLELLSGHGASTRMGLDDVAVAVGLPGKAGESGAKVAELVERGEIGRVRDYCETDTLNTLGVYFRWALLSGRTDEEGHDASVASMMEYLASQRAARPHLGAFLDRWQGSDRPVPTLVGGKRP